MWINNPLFCWWRRNTKGLQLIWITIKIEYRKLKALKNIKYKD